MYFSQFPTLDYDIKGNDNPKLVTDILKRIRVRKGLSTNVIFFIKHYIQEGETPERLSDKLYGSTEFHWVILITNNIIDPFYGWPLTNVDLNAFITDKYGAGNEQTVHHFENAGGYTVNSDAPFAVPISNSLYEDRMNEESREINILKPEFLQSFANEFDELINRKIK